MSWVFDYLFNVGRIGLGVRHQLVVDLLVAALTEATRVICLVFVLTFRRLLLVAGLQVALVTHQFGLVASLLMLASANGLKLAKDVIVVE